MVDCACALVRRSIRTRTSSHEDPFELQPLLYARACKVPALVGVSTTDEYVSEQQPRSVAAALCASTSVVVQQFAAKHFEYRPHTFLAAVCSFIAGLDGLNDEIALSASEELPSRRPWAEEQQSQP
jgi:hypothetical protein